MGTPRTRTMPSNCIPQQGGLLAGGEIRSNNGEYRLCMQDDGNLVVYRTSDNHPTWATKTNNEHGNGKNYCMFQGDHNFVVYDESGQYHWASAISNGEAPGPAHLIMQDDGNLVQYTTDLRPVWCTRTDNGQDGSYEGGIDTMMDRDGLFPQ